jgi:mRNA interferase RelE/StbE
LNSKSKALFGYAYSERALKYLETLNKKLRTQIINKIETLADDPIPPGSKLIKSTAGDVERIYRIRSGDYRVLYVVRNNPTHVVVLDIGHRKDVYK